MNNVVNNVPVDWLRYVWIIPIVMGFVTFVLTSLFTVFRERKNNNIPRRVFLEYAEYEMEYPFGDKPKHGEGRILVGENGKKLIQNANTHGGSDYTFMVINNITENDIINVKIKFVFSDRPGKRGSLPKEIITEEFFMPVWKSADTIYIPSTIYNSSSKFSTNEELLIEYTTTGFEHFRYSYVREYSGKYTERLEIRYLGFMWLPKVNYHQGDFYRFIRVRNKEEE